MAAEMSAGSIDDLIEAWPNNYLHDPDSHFEHPLPGAWTYERDGSSGVFSEDLVIVFGIDYEHLRDYRSPYADVSELWEGSFE